MKPAPMPWIGCGPGWPPEMTGDCSAPPRRPSDPAIPSSASSAQPVRWPPVPTPVIRHAGGVSVKSSRISCAVVRAWISTLAGFSNCCGIHALSVSLDQLRGALDRALHALFLGRQIEARAIGQHQAAAFDAHALGHDQHQLVALDRGDHGKADAGVAAGRLDDRAAGLQSARSSPRLPPWQGRCGP